MAKNIEIDSKISCLTRLAINLLGSIDIGDNFEVSGSDDSHDDKMVKRLSPLKKPN